MLTEKAARDGQTVEEYLTRLAEQAVAAEPAAVAASPEARAAAWRAWAAGHVAAPVIADDDRESIYAGRGE
jgi:hypothetical protein